MKQKKIKFIGSWDEAEFCKVLTERVNGYFRTNNLSPKGNTKLYIKSTIMLCLYLVPYLALLAFEINPWAALVLVSIMGLGKAGIGMNITHDAAHAAYAKTPRVNRWLSRVVWLIGNNDTSWDIQHNYYHHNWTNVEGADEDLGTQKILIFSKHAQTQKRHTWQHFYAWPLYTLLTITKLFGEIFRIKTYATQGLPKKYHPDKWAEYRKLFCIKTLYLFCMIILPIMVTDFIWWEVFIGFLAMHMIASFALSLIFQLAHIVEGADQPKPVNGTVNRHWCVHELASTANFKTVAWFEWFIGCLNYQIEHHLFRHVCHIHYPSISIIVRDTAREFGFAYNLKPSFFQAVSSHYRQLKILGGGFYKSD